VFRPEGCEGKREPWDRKLICVLAAIGYVDGLGNIWCFRNGQNGGRWLVSEW